MEKMPPSSRSLALTAAARADEWYECTQRALVNSLLRHNFFRPVGVRVCTCVYVCKGRGKENRRKRNDSMQRWLA